MGGAVSNTNNKISNKLNVNSDNNFTNANLNTGKDKNIPKVRNTHVDEKNLFEPIGILDPEGLRNNPFTGKPYENLYKDDSSIGNPTYVSLAQKWSKFPVYSKIKEIIKSLYNHQVILVASGTGSGKTVVVPKLAIHCLNYQGRVVITNPKRTPTFKNAEYAAMCMDVKLGTYVGMKYRDSDPKAYSEDCRLIYATDGWVLQKLQKDPMLADLDCVIIDEAHERGIQIDLLLLLLKELLVRRPDFKVIIMSATVNAKIFSDYFPKDKFKFDMIDAGEVPNYPIEEIFIDKSINTFDAQGNLISDSYIEAAVDKVIFILRKYDKGDILVFFPGKGDTSDGCMLLHRKMEKLNRNLDKKIYCNPLTSTTDEETKKILTNPTKFKESGQYTRKVIFATEVAESSITFDGLDFVVETGLSNNNRFYSEKNMMALEKNYISKASHKQRKGRTGRTQPGMCFNLFTKEEYEKFRDYRVTPISIDDISVPLLYFLSKKHLVSHIDFPITYIVKKKVGGGRPKKVVIEPNKTNNNKSVNSELTNNKKSVNKSMLINESQGIEFSQFLHKLIEVPPIDTVKIVVERLIALGMIDMKDKVGTISNLGLAISAFEVLPEIGRMLISGYNHHCREDVVNLAALYELTEFRLDSLFENFRPSVKNNAIKKAEKQHYDKVISKWTNQMGDQFSMIDIYNSFCQYKYNQIDRRTGAIIKNKKGDARQWCREHFLRYNVLDRVREASRQIDRNFGKVMQIFYKAHPGNKPSYIFLKSPPTISEKKSDNILKAIFDGFYINLMKKTGTKYTNCFPHKKTTGTLARESLFAKIKSPTKYAIYTQLKSIFGKTNYAIVAKVPPTMIEELMKSNEGKCVEYCFKTMNEEKMINNKQKKGHHKKQWTHKKQHKKFK